MKNDYRGGYSQLLPWSTGTMRDVTAIDELRSQRNKKCQWLEYL